MKPEELFKVGDYLVVENKVQGMIVKITDYPSLVIDTGESYGLTLCSVWHPKEGEFCLFWDDSTLQRVDLRKFAGIEKDTYGTLCFWDSEGTPYQNIAPFIGRLPSFLKEINE